MSLVVVWNTACSPVDCPNSGLHYFRRIGNSSILSLFQRSDGAAYLRFNTYCAAMRKRPGTKEAGKIAISRLSLGKEGALQGGLLIHRLKPHQHVPSMWLLYCATIERCDEKGPRIGFHCDARAPLRQLDVNFFAQSQSANQKISMDPNLLLNCFSNVLSVEVETSSPHLVDED
ncbi:predicted protein [Histoplasma capsulatum G186AR]|uniref:Uncharacterized protein n=1 Tax=Ajellomyces capsulatus (strain G186AR / H82 / ATCC MYA-2454 / RMSCC 2432) TaxID=447093 RepID=C0NYA0_AJECG|nr:uncharacterized protein HCBG_07894 [Histoplasma capsulatum G186AR]EEH03768.1 predicted protein [Histoplasma capsulatum G186AR]